jgi:hypothetical protein
VVADEQHRVHVGCQSRHHPAGFGCAAQQLGAPVQQFGQKVPELRVGLSDQHLGVWLVGMDTADGGVDLGREQFAVPLVLAMAGPDIVAVDDAGDALHVD